MLREYDFKGNPRAVEYLQANLAHGGSLSQLLLEKRLERGKITAYLPENVTPAHALEFERLIVSGSKTRALIAKNIVRHLAKVANYAVLEDVCAKPTYPAVKNRTEKIIVYDLEVFYFLSHVDRKRALDEIAEFLRVQRCLPAVGVLTSLENSHEELQDGKHVDYSTLKTLAQNTIQFFALTYDDTGYLIWTSV